MDKLIPWLVVAMMRWMHLETGLPPDAKLDYEARYAQVAFDASEVAFDPLEAPLFPGTQGRIKTTALMLAVAGMEGAYKDTAVGDRAQSVCMMQIHLPGDSRVRLTDDGGFAYGGIGSVGKRELSADRKLCLRVGLHILRHSMRVCGGNLSAYTSGRCRKGEPKSEARMTRAMRLFDDASQTPGLDSDFSLMRR